MTDLDQVLSAKERAENALCNELGDWLEGLSLDQIMLLKRLYDLHMKLPANWQDYEYVN